MPTVTPRDATGTGPAIADIPARPIPETARQPDTSVEAKPPEQALSPKFAALARRERQLLDLDRKIKEREKAVADRETKLTSQLESDYIPRSAIKEKKIQVLIDAGYSRDDIANMLLNEHQSQGPSTSFVESELQKVREELKAATEKTQNDLSERDRKGREQAMKQVTSQASALIAGSPDDYEMVSKNGGAEVIAKYIERTFDEEGVLMTVDDAAKFIENELLAETLELFKLKKVQERAKLELFPQPIAQAPEVKQGLQVTARQPQQIKTLTNQHASKSTVGNQTSAERTRRAIMRARGLDPDAVG